jgi:hypothetical protein
MIPLPNYRKMSHLRLRELEKLYRSRYGAILPDDDAGMEDMADALHHIPFMSGDVTGKMMGWIQKWAPWLRNDQARALCERIVDDPQRFEADELGYRMRLDVFERERLEITTFSAFNMPKVWVLEDGTKHLLREAYRKAFKNRKRRDERKQRERPTITATQPWKAEGMSRATWYRKRSAEKNVVL